MKKCKCIKEDLSYVFDEDHLIKDSYYFYDFYGRSSNFYIYKEEDDDYIHIFTKEKFDEFFIDIQEERKQKLKKINEQ
jgi:hypothetical protein